MCDRGPWSPLRSRVGRSAGEEQLDRLLRYDDSPTEPQVRQLATCHELVRVRTRDAEHPARLLDGPHEPTLVSLHSLYFVHFDLHGLATGSAVLTPMGEKRVDAPERDKRSSDFLLGAVSKACADFLRRVPAQTSAQRCGADGAVQRCGAEVRCRPAVQTYRRARGSVGGGSSRCLTGCLRYPPRARDSDRDRAPCE